MTGQRRATYHHGDLAGALRATALQAVRGQGAHAFSLRAVAREVGVDIAAVYRHFRSKADLLEAVRIEALGLLETRMLTNVERAGSSAEQLQGVGRAYVEFALDEPKLFRLVFGPVANPSRESEPRSRSAYTLLVDALHALRAEHGCTLEIDDAATVAWAAVHGLASLSVDGPMAPAATRSKIDVVLESVTRSLIP